MFCVLGSPMQLVVVTTVAKVWSKVSANRSNTVAIASIVGVCLILIDVSVANQRQSQSDRQVS